MKQMIIGVLGVVLAGCIPGEATIKLSAENVRRVLRGEIVEVPVHGEVELMAPIAPGDDEMKCPECQGRGIDLTNAVMIADRRACAATRVLALLLADGSCVTGGVKIVGTNVVHWATLDTKFLCGTEAAIRAASNKVEHCNGVFVLNDKGEVDLECGRRKDMPLQKVKRIYDVLEAVADGCKSCKDVYGEVGMILDIGSYDSVLIAFEGDGQGGFCVETGDKRVAAEQIGKELQCNLRRKDSGEKGKTAKPIKVRKD
jgi:hypothetical protein